jgi:hypothetical protein
LVFHQGLLELFEPPGEVLVGLPELARVGIKLGLVGVTGHGRGGVGAGRQPWGGGRRDRSRIRGSVDEGAE